MHIKEFAIEEIALEGLEGASLSKLWTLLEERKPSVDFNLDSLGKQYIFKAIVNCKFITFHHINYGGPRQNEIKKVNERCEKLPQFWVNNLDNGEIGYSPSYFYRRDISNEIRGEGSPLSLQEVKEKWGDDMHMVASQDFRRRLLYSKNMPPVLEEITPIRYITLEIVGKARWEGLLQYMFLHEYGIDSRTIFYHIKYLLRLGLITKQQIVKRTQNTDTPNRVFTVQPKTTNLLHLTAFSNIFTDEHLQHAAKVCHILSEAPDEIMERNELVRRCKDVPNMKRVRKWLFTAGYIQYIVNGQIINSHNTTLATQNILKHGKCYVNLISKFTQVDIDDDKDDDFLAVINESDDIEPRLVYEKTLHQQAYMVIRACGKRGMSIKKLTEVLCIPFVLGRSIVRYISNNKLARLIVVDEGKLKAKKLVATEFIKEGMIEVEYSKGIPGIMPAAESARVIGAPKTKSKSKISPMLLARRKFILDTLAMQPVQDGHVEMLNALRAVEAKVPGSGICCRKTFRRILEELAAEKQIVIIPTVIDEDADPPVMRDFYCSPHITPDNDTYKTILLAARNQSKHLLMRHEMKKAAQARRSLAQKGGTEDPAAKSQKVRKMANKDWLFTDVNSSEANVYTDTEDESFEVSVPGTPLPPYHSRYSKFGRFQKLHMFHLYLWHLVYGTAEDMAYLQATSGSPHPDRYIDVISSKHVWLMSLKHLAPSTKHGIGWFNIGQLIEHLPLVVACYILGFRCHSSTIEKYLADSNKRLVLLCDLPPRLKYKILIGQQNKGYFESCIELLVILAQMGLVAVHPENYPNVRSQIDLFLRREAKIVDTRTSKKNYCHTELPEGAEKFPETKYEFRSLSDVSKYWMDLQYISLNTPLGMREARVKNESGVDADKQELAKWKKHYYRSYTVLRDFQPHYENRNFQEMEPDLFGNGLGAAGLDSTLFSHLSKNWKCGQAPGKRKQSSVVRIKEEAVPPKLISTTQVDQATSSVEKEVDSAPIVPIKKVKVSKMVVKHGPKGKNVCRRSKAKLCDTERVKQIAKRYEQLREQIRLKNHAARAVIVAKKRLARSAFHDDQDKEALQRMKTERVVFSAQEDMLVILADVVRCLMKLNGPGKPLEKEASPSRIVWKAIRDILHEKEPQLRDKTALALDRRARYMKKSSSNTIFKTCESELKNSEDFCQTILCTTDNWKEKLKEGFEKAQEFYSKHFTPEINEKEFPLNNAELESFFKICYADQRVTKQESTVVQCLSSEQQIRVLVLRDLIHNSLVLQQSKDYQPAQTFQVFDCFPRDDIAEALQWYKQNFLISRQRIELPHPRRVTPLATTAYRLSMAYFKLYEPSIPLKIFTYHYQNKNEDNTTKTQWKFDPEHVQGCHIAYAMSELVSHTGSIQMSLPEEITICDPSYIPKHLSGPPKFQRIAFEQRVKHGTEFEKYDNVVGKGKGINSFYQTKDSSRVPSFASTHGAGFCDKLFLNNSRFFTSTPVRTTVHKVGFKLSQSSLHASHTSLRMQRAIPGLGNSKKHLPTNALNTHDTLKVLPIGLTFCKNDILQYRDNLFDVSVVSEIEKQKIERQLKIPDSGTCQKFLTLDEYVDVLKTELHFTESDIQLHQKILEKVLQEGSLGLMFEECISLTKEDVLKSKHNLSYHLQTLYNFNMLVKVGKHVSRLVAAKCFHPWCYNAPMTPTISSTESSSIKDEKKEKSDSFSNDMRIIKVEPWLKLDGDLNEDSLKRFQEVVLVYIMKNPGCLLKSLIENFKTLLSSESVRTILDFLVLTECVKKRFQQRKKPTLFSNLFVSHHEDQSETEEYYIPTKSCFSKLKL